MVIHNEQAESGTQNAVQDGNKAAVRRPPSAFRSSGFTLVEMLVVIGIITVISALVLANNNRFGGQVLLQNLAYDVALSIRQAQVYGISVQRFKETSTFAPGYGIYMNASSPTTYVVFGDLGTPNGVYDINEAVETNQIQSGYAISKLQVQSAQAPGVWSDVSKINITFRRPEPDAYIVANDDVLSFDSRGKLIGSQPLKDQARIEVRSPRGDIKYVTVSVSGQISVQ